MSITIEIGNLLGWEAPLYQPRPGGAGELSRAFLEIDEEGRVQPIMDYATDGVPMDVYHGRRLWIRVSPYWGGDALANLLHRDDVVALLERIHAGHEIYAEDGVSWRGRLTEGAMDAREDLERLLKAEEADGLVMVAPAEEMLSDEPAVWWPEGVTLDTVIYDIVSDARAQGVVIYGSVVDAIHDRLETMLRYGVPGLQKHHLRLLLDSGWITAAEAEDYQDAEEETR